MKYCIYCGAQLEKNCTECPDCGRALPVNGNGASFGSRQGENQAPYNQPQGNQPPYGQPMYTQNQYTQPPLGNQYGQNPYGSPNQYNPYQKPENPSDTGSALYFVLALFFPLVGIILYCVTSKDNPKNGKQLIKGFIAAVVIRFVLGVIAFILSLVFQTIVFTTDFGDYMYNNMEEYFDYAENFFENEFSDLMFKLLK